MLMKEISVQRSALKGDKVGGIWKARIQICLCWFRKTLFNLWLFGRREWNRELCVLDVSVGGEGLMRNKNLTHTGSIISAFEEMKLSMQTLRMKHLIVLDICSIYSKQSLILREEQAALRQKLLTILVHSKAHFIAIPIDNSLS